MALWWCRWLTEEFSGIELGSMSRDRVVVISSSIPPASSLSQLTRQRQRAEICIRWNALMSWLTDERRTWRPASLFLVEVIKRRAERMDVMPFDQQQEQRIKQAERIGPELSADQQTPVGATDNVARVQCRFAALVEWTVLEHGTCLFQFFVGMLRLLSHLLLIFRPDFRSFCACYVATDPHFPVDRRFRGNPESIDCCWQHKVIGVKCYRIISSNLIFSN